MTTPNNEAAAHPAPDSLIPRTEQDIITAAVQEHLEYRKREERRSEIEKQINELQVELHSLSSVWASNSRTRSSSMSRTAESINVPRTT
jgi:hypothetical protein